MCFLHDCDINFSNRSVDHSFFMRSVAHQHTMTTRHVYVKCTKTQKFAKIAFMHTRINLSSPTDVGRFICRYVPLPTYKYFDGHSSPLTAIF